MSENAVSEAGKTIFYGANDGKKHSFVKSGRHS